MLCIGWLVGNIKKHVTIINTEESSNMITYNNKPSREHTVPAAISYYNLHTGEADLIDMRTYMFLSERRTVRWNKKIFLNYQES